MAPLSWRRSVHAQQLVSVSHANTLKTRANLNHNWQIVKSLFIKVACLSRLRYRT